MGMNKLAMQLLLGVMCFCLAGTGYALTPETILVDFDSVWRYHDGNEDLGDAWRMPDYPDDAWSQGPGLLGYDTGGRTGRWPEPGLQTEMEPNLLTYYLRTSFVYTGDAEGQQLKIEQILDDAAVYYLNGEEIARSALMPEGPVTFETAATGFTNPWETQDLLLIDNPPLVQGTNILAVSLHNNNTSSSDICLGLRVSLIEPVVEPLAFYLTWQQDPTTTMTIQWHTEGVEAGTVIYGDADGQKLGEKDTVQSQPIPGIPRWVHTVELTDLQPDAEYTFRFSAHASSSVYRFRTMPATLDRPVRLAIGGDVRHRQSWMEEVNRIAMRYDLDAIVWGGDLAYADGLVRRWYRWDEFFDAMKNTLVDESGRVVPVLMGIGNHEVKQGYFFRHAEEEDPVVLTDAFRNEIAPFYYSMFAFPGHPGYGVLDVSDYLSIILLDTDHSTPVAGPQTEWFEEVLRARTDILHVLPVYHVPAYPSHRSFSGRVSVRVREHWVPLMERYGIQVAFENHDHTYKRTVPLRNGEEAADGIIYIGDGAWGVGERVPRTPEEEWYLARSSAIRHFLLVTLSEHQRDIKVMTRNGNLLDHIVQPVKR